MTRAGKYLTLFLVEIGLLGAAFGGGYYFYTRKGALVSQFAECDKERRRLSEAEKLFEKQRRLIVQLKARGLLMEAQVAALKGNYGIAFERVAAAQLSAQQGNLGLDSEFTEVTALLLAQNQQVKDRLPALADKVLSTSDGSSSAPAMPPVKAVPPAMPPPAPVPAAAHVPAPAFPAAAPRSSHPQPRDQSGWGPGGALEEAYQALLDAKTAYLAGENTAIVQKLARARVMLDEAGHQDLDEELDALIVAARRRDQTKVLVGVEAILRKLRSP